MHRQGMSMLGNYTNVGARAPSWEVQTLPGSPWVQPPGGEAVGAVHCASGTGRAKSWPLPSFNPNSFADEGQLFPMVPGSMHPREELGWDLDPQAL